MSFKAKNNLFLSILYIIISFALGILGYIVIVLLQNKHNDKRCDKLKEEIENRKKEDFVNV